MSRETQQWLENNIMVGFTAKRGQAWWYRGVDRADGSPNHYEGAIPAGDVESKLFGWEPATTPVLISVPVLDKNGQPVVTPDGETLMDYREIPGKQAIVPSDNPSHVFGIFSDSYQPHGYSEWLIGNVSNILSDTLQISSAGLLKGRAVAWVEVSVPDTITTPQGVAFRPNMLATTSLDGTVATTYKRTCTLTVCDNTWGMAMAEKGQTYKRKHTRYSAGKLEQDKAREALAMVMETADAVQLELAKLCEIEVTAEEFRKVVHGVVPIDDSTSKTGVTVAERKRGEVTALYQNDNRVAPWAGTAFGVMQAFNTWGHHVKPTRGDTERAERNMLSTINGSVEKDDAAVWAELTKVLQLS